MMNRFVGSLSDGALLLRLSLRVQLGRWGWLVPALALLWPAYHTMTVLAGWRQKPFEPGDVQNGLIALPLVVLAIGLGVRVVAAEIDQRTLEVAYTVPGGARRMWIAKLAAAATLLLAAGLPLAICAALMVRYPLSSLYGAAQGVVFYLVLTAWLGALLRNEITAALVASIVLALNGFMMTLGDAPARWSPLFNPLIVRDADKAQLFAWSVQNRIGFLLLILALVTLTCARAERREELLS